MTIKDIAKEAGCAVSTVSRALNNHPDVSADTKIKIKEIIARNGFVPNSNARRLKVQQSRTISIVVKGAANMFFAGILEVLQTEICGEGYEVQVHYIDEDANEVLVGEQIVRESKPLGLIFLGGNVEEFKRSFGEIDLPSVLATTMSRELAFSKLAVVGVDDVAAGAKACQYLVGQGHRSIAVFGGNPTLSYISALRYNGFANAYKRLTGAQHDPTLFCKVPFSAEGGQMGMKRLLEVRRDVTAVFCMSDLLAFGVMRAAADVGISVPQKLSVLGFDGIPLGQYIVPRLTSLRQPQAEIARESVRLLLAQIEKGTPGATVILKTTLIEGESVAPL